MKKTLILLAAALVAAVTLTAAASSSDNAGLQGTVSFESASMPALNFTMPLHRAADIYPLVPDNIREICAREYATVRTRCQSSSDFRHEGVKVRVQQQPGTSALTVSLSSSGYTVTASNVRWQDLDALFAAGGGE